MALDARCRCRVMGSFVWLLLIVAASADTYKTARKLQQSELATPDVQGTGSRARLGRSGSGGRQPFLAVKDPVRASSKDAQRMYEQGASVSSIAYLLFAAAKPLSEVPGSSKALLPYLTPNVMRFYASNPARCGGDTTQALYELSSSLLGTDARKACYYDLYRALEATFSWIRDNIELRRQEIDDQPDLAAYFPDATVYPDLELMAAVYSALKDANKLGEAAAGVEAACGMDRADFAVLIPRVSAVLADLHADLPLLQQLAEQPHAARWHPGSGPNDHDDDTERDNRRRAALETSAAEEEDLLQAGSGTGATATPAIPNGSCEGADAGSNSTDGEGHGNDIGDGGVKGRHMEAVLRRGLLALPSNFFYSFPQSGYLKLAPTAMPAVMIPLIVHIMLYSNTDGSIGPDNYQQAVSYMQRMVKITNIMSKPTNIQFFLKEVRNDPAAYPYLLLSNRTVWLNAPASRCTGTSCFSSSSFMNQIVADWPRSINVFIVSDSSSGVPLGYAYVPGSDLRPENGHVFVSWDSISTSGSNNLAVYNDGPNTLLHELFHHLGLNHPFGTTTHSSSTCEDYDYVIDTPAVLAPVTSSGFQSTALSYCMQLFWGTYGGDWEATYTRWSTQLGIPEADMNAWADSCPTMFGYDELGNYMTYNTPVCFAALGHFTVAQAQAAHYITAEMNPLLYSWGQYYAQNAAPPPPMASPPPESYDNICRATARSQCPCKSSWTLGGKTLSYCDRAGTTNQLTCEVANPSTCPDCTSGVTCVLSCTGTPWNCKRSSASGNSPPPPPPLPPHRPPYPPPPPPRANSVPSSCKVSSAGCACRSSWAYGTKYYSYCASPNGDSRLWCQISSNCSLFNNSAPYQYCDRGLTLAQCGTRDPVFFSTTRTPPAPPAPPPNLMPRPPPTPGSSGIVAQVRGSFTVQANCSLITTNGTALRNDIMSVLVTNLGVPSTYISFNLSCGSIIVTYVVNFPVGADPDKVLEVTTMANALALTVSSTFTGRWGAISAATGSAVVLDEQQLCATNPTPSTICTASPPPPPMPPLPPPPAPPPSPESKKGISTTIIIIICATAGGVLLIVLLVIVIVCCARKKKVAPQPNQMQPGGQQAASPGAYGSPPPQYNQNPYATAPPTYQQQPYGYQQQPYQQQGYPPYR